MQAETLPSRCCLPSLCRLYVSFFFPFFISSPIPFGSVTTAKVVYTGFCSGTVMAYLPRLRHEYTREISVHIKTTECWLQLDSHGLSERDRGVVEVIPHIRGVPCLVIYDVFAFTNTPVVPED